MAYNCPALLAYQVFPVGEDVIDSAMPVEFRCWLEWRRWGFLLTGALDLLRDTCTPEGRDGRKLPAEGECREHI